MFRIRSAMSNGMKTSHPKTFARAVFFTFLLMAAVGVNVAAQSKRIIKEGHATCEDYERLKAEMRRVYAQVLREYKDDAQFIERFKAAQELWESYRVAHLFELYPDTSSLAYGSINQQCQCSVASDFTRERIRLVQEWLTGAADADACAGSIKPKRELSGQGHSRSGLKGRTPPRGLSQAHNFH